MNKWGLYKKDNQLRFKSLMLRPTLCDSSDTYILLSGTVTIPGWIRTR